MKNRKRQIEALIIGSFLLLLIICGMAYINRVVDSKVRDLRYFTIQEISRLHGEVKK